MQRRLHLFCLCSRLPKVSYGDHALVGSMLMDQVCLKSWRVSCACSAAATAACRIAALLTRPPIEEVAAAMP